MDDLVARAAAGMKPGTAERLRRHILATLLCPGRHTVTGHLCAAGRQFDDWSADYRMLGRPGRMDPERLFEPVRRDLLDRLPAGEPAVCAMDDTRIRKTGRKVHGAAYTRDPLGPPFHVNLIRAQRFVQSSIIAPDPDGPARCVPVDFHHAPPAPKPRADAPSEQRRTMEEERRRCSLPRVGALRTGRLRESMDRDGHAGRTLVSVVDGGYTNAAYLKNLPERTVCIGRLRSDAKLYDLPEEQPVRGRRRVYGEPAPAPEELRTDPAVPWIEVRAFAAGQWRNFKIKTPEAPVRWRATGRTHDLRLVVIAPLGYRLRKGSRILYRKPAFLICTDFDMPLEKVLQAYVRRWDIEVNFRDEKSVLGVGQAEVRNQRSVQNAPALGVAAYAMALCAATALGERHEALHRLPPPRWNPAGAPRATIRNIVDHLRAEVWGHALDLSHFEPENRDGTKSHKIAFSPESALLYASHQA